MLNKSQVYFSYCCSGTWEAPISKSKADSCFVRLCLHFLCFSSTLVTRSKWLNVIPTDLESTQPEKCKRSGRDSFYPDSDLQPYKKSSKEGRRIKHSLSLPTNKTWFQSCKIPNKRREFVHCTSPQDGCPYKNSQFSVTALLQWYVGKEQGVSPKWGSSGWTFIPSGTWSCPRPAVRSRLSPTALAAHGELLPDVFSCQPENTTSILQPSFFYFLGYCTASVLSWHRKSGANGKNHIS